MMPSNKRFTNRVTPSVLEIGSPHFYARPSQASAIRKDRASYFVSNPVHKYFHYLSKIKAPKNQ